MRYRTVLLDVGETLIGPRRPYHAVYARVFHGLGLDLPVERFADALAHALRELGQRIPRGTDRFGYFPGGEAEYWRRLVTACVEQAAGGKVDADLISRGVESLRDHFATAEAWQIYPDSVPALETLRGHGVRLGIVSNWDSRLPAVLRTIGLARYFEAVGVSHLEGCEKPSPDLFHRVLARLGVGVDGAIHVGDLPEADLEGARRAGIDGVLIDRDGRLEEDGAKIADLGALCRLVLDGPGGWDHEHCSICDTHIDVQHPTAYTTSDGIWWLCSSCYERHARTHDVSFQSDIAVDG